MSADSYFAIRQMDTGYYIAMFYGDDELHGLSDDRFSMGPYGTFEEATLAGWASAVDPEDMSLGIPSLRPDPGSEPHPSLVQYHVDYDPDWDYDWDENLDLNCEEEEELAEIFSSLDHATVTAQNKMAKALWDNRRSE